MRELNSLETEHVSGAGGSRSLTNNGYGNGAEGLPPPGKSGSHNPNLGVDGNTGPKGPR